MFVDGNCAGRDRFGQAPLILIDARRQHADFLTGAVHVELRLGHVREQRLIRLNRRRTGVDRRMKDRRDVYNLSCAVHRR